MDILKKTYRLVTALTLFLFVSGIVIPVGLSATSLNCDMDMSAGFHTCCIAVDMSSHQEKKDIQDCEQQIFCEQAIDSSPSDIPAITQSSKTVIAATLLEELTTIRKDSDHPPAVKNEHSSLHYHPPIFLLNSTFLN